eukprot:scaffold52553_cov48-Attheya_sp.AAC.2
MEYSTTEKAIISVKDAMKSIKNCKLEAVKEDTSSEILWSELSMMLCSGVSVIVVARVAAAASTPCV